jgi:hypothetical protein
LDDLINQRRQELSELRRTNRQRLSDPHKTAAVGEAEVDMRGRKAPTSGEHDPHGFHRKDRGNISPSAYEEVREGEQRLSRLLSVEQARVRELEIVVADLQAQCDAHADEVKILISDRDKFKALCDESEEEMQSLREEIQHLAETVGIQSCRIEELEAQSIAMKATEQSLLKEIELASSLGPQVQNGSVHMRTTLETGPEIGSELSVKSCDADGARVTMEEYNRLLEDFTSLEAETSDLRQYCEQAASANAEWASKVEELETIKHSLEAERQDATSIAYQWQAEALRLEKELSLREEALVETRKHVGSLQARIQELEHVVSTSSPDQTSSQSASVVDGHGGQMTPTGELKPRQVSHKSTETDTDLYPEGKLGVVVNTNADVAVRSRYSRGFTQRESDEAQAAFWDADADDDDDDQNDNSQAETPASNFSKQSSVVLSSVAKRVLLTWDKSAVETKRTSATKNAELHRVKARKAISVSTFLMLVSFIRLFVHI